MKNRKRKLFISVIILLLMSGCSEANIKIKIDSISLATEQTETTVNSIPTESFIPITTEFPTQPLSQVPTQTPVQPSTQVPTETQTEISTETQTEISTESSTVSTTEQSSEELSTEQPTEKSTPEHIKQFVDLPRYGMITMSCKGTVFHNLDNSLEEVELSPNYHVNVLFEKAEHYIISWYNDDTAQVKKECIELYDIDYEPIFETGTWVGVITDGTEKQLYGLTIKPTHCVLTNEQIFPRIPQYKLVKVLGKFQNKYVIKWYASTALIETSVINIIDDINSVGIAKCPSDYIGFEIIE